MFRNRAGRRRWLVDVAASIFCFHFHHMRPPFWDVSFRFAFINYRHQWPNRGITSTKCPTAFPATRGPNNSNTPPPIPSQTNQPASHASHPSLPSSHPPTHPSPLKQRKRARESPKGRAVHTNSKIISKPDEQPLIHPRRPQNTLSEPRTTVIDLSSCISPYRRVPWK